MRFKFAIMFCFVFFASSVRAQPEKKVKWVATHNTCGTVMVDGSDDYNEYWLDWVFHLASTELVNFIEFGVAMGPLMERTFQTYFDATEMYNLNRDESRSQFYGVDMAESHLEATQTRIEENFGREVSVKQLKLIEGTLPVSFEYPEGVEFDGAAIFRTLHFLNEMRSIIFLKNLSERLHRGRPVIATVESIFLPIVSDKDREAHFLRELRDRTSRPYVLEELPSEYTAKTGSVGKRYFHTVESLTLLFEVAGYEVMKCGYIDRSKTFPEYLLHQDPAHLPLNSKLSIGIVAIRKSPWHPLQRILKTDPQDLVDKKLRKNRLGRQG